MLKNDTTTLDVVFLAFLFVLIFVFCSNIFHYNVWRPELAFSFWFRFRLNLYFVPKSLQFSKVSPAIKINWSKLSLKQWQFLYFILHHLTCFCFSSGIGLSFNFGFYSSEGLEY